MNNARAGLFEAEDDLDISGFAPKKPEPGGTLAAAEEVRAISEASNFHSREPAAGKLTQTTRPRRAPRLHRTGRNVQFNVKARQETVDSFYEIADQQGWVLGETLERALEALLRELVQQK